MEAIDFSRKLSTLCLSRIPSKKLPHVKLCTKYICFLPCRMKLLMVLKPFRLERCSGCYSAKSQNALIHSTDVCSQCLHVLTSVYMSSIYQALTLALEYGAKWHYPAPKALWSLGQGIYFTPKFLILWTNPWVNRDQPTNSAPYWNVRTGRRGKIPSVLCCEPQTVKSSSTREESLETMALWFPNSPKSLFPKCNQVNQRNGHPSHFTWRWICA